MWIPEKNSNGIPISAPTFEDVGNLTPVWKGFLYVAAPMSLSMFDQVITSQERLREGWFRILLDGHIGDYIECSIVDKDDVLGMFSALNLVVGVDVLEIKKYVKTEYVAPEDKGRQEFKSNSVSELMPGLFLRVSYLNIGSEPVTFTVTKKFYEA